MKKIIILFLLAFSVLLAGDKVSKQASGNTFDTFINHQMDVESKLLEQNLTTKEREKIRKDQDLDYQKFFFQYAADKNNYGNYVNPYLGRLNKLRIRISRNKARGYKLAVERSEIQLQQYYIRNGIRQILHSALGQSRSHSKEFFIEKINEMISDAFKSYKPMDKSAYYEELKKNPNNSIAMQLKNELNKLEAMESVGNTFSSQLIENSSDIYAAGKFADSRLFELIEKIDGSPVAKKLDEHLSFLHIDTKILLVFTFAVLLILIINFIIYNLINISLRYRKASSEDIDYVHHSITRLIYVITAVLIVNLMLVFYYGIDAKSVTISRFFGVIYIALVALLLYRLTDVIAYFKIERLQQSKILKKEVLNLLIKVTKTLIVFAAVIGILVLFDVDLTALLSGLGIGGFAVAFAAKDSISNIFGSVSILLGDLFEQGDWIEGNGVNGTVVEIGLRATTLRTFDNALISVPNFKLASEEIKNWSRRTIGRRIKMQIGVTYESDFGDIKKAIDDIRTMLKNHPDIAGSGTKYQNSLRRSSKLVSFEDFKGIKRTTLVFMDEFADSSINILVYCFSKSVVWEEWLDTKEDVMYKIADILEKNNLEFAYPAISIHQASDTQENRDENGNKISRNDK